MAHVEQIKGVLAATVTTSGWGWVTENVNMSTFGFIGSIAATVACWFMLRKEKLAESERHKNTAQALDDLKIQMASLHVNDVAIANMIERFHAILTPAKDDKST